MHRVLLLTGVLWIGAWGQFSEGGRGSFGVGYDEGLAARLFFTEKMGAQLSVGLEVLGGWDNAREDVGTEADFSVAGAFLYNVIASRLVYVDALGQIGMARDDTRDPDGIEDRVYGFLRAALAPELLLGDRLGLGLRFGVELVYVGESEEERGGEVVETDDGHFNFRFFGPGNPFEGSTLGMSVFVYF